MKFLKLTRRVRETDRRVLVQIEKITAIVEEPDGVAVVYVEGDSCFIVKETLEQIFKDLQNLVEGE